MKKIIEILKFGKKLLQEHNIPNASLDAELLLCNILDKNRVYLHTWPDKELNKEQSEKFISLLDRRKSGEPIAYILGTKEFYGLDFIVNNNVLVPRPETEILVEEALKLIPKEKALRVLDLGTGSGAIAISIAKNRPKSNIVAIDKSKNALDIAQKNAKLLEVNNIEFYEGSWFSPLNINEKFDIIVSNPPYIGEHDPMLESNVKSFEPNIALIAAENGLADIKYIIKNSVNYLNKSGCLLLEHGYNQEEDIKNIFDIYNFANVKSIEDLAGINRVILGCFS